jgi:triosephosphate isomerase
VQRLAIGNWKMNTTRDEAVALATAVAEGLGAVDGWDPSSLRVGVAPPFPFLDAVGMAIQGSPLELVAQDVHSEPRGAFTSAVSAEMLASVGVQRVIVGHSERRKHFGDTDDVVNHKLKAVLAAGLEAIVCVGEQLAQRESGDYEQVVKAQLEAALKGIDGIALERVTVAYEPVWAIGTGKTATPAEVGAMHQFIRELVKTAGAPGLPILYGGSVKPGNARELSETPEVGGVLVGGASLKAESFVDIVRGCQPSPDRSS